MTLAAIPCLLFLLAASAQDVRYRVIDPHLVGLWLAVGLVGALVGEWEWSAFYMVSGFVTLWGAGTPLGDRVGGALIGGYLGMMGLFGIMLALGLALGWWRTVGRHRSPADFAFYPFLLAGTSGMIALAWIVREISG